MKQTIIILLMVAAINCTAQKLDFTTPVERAKNLPDSTIIGYRFVINETVNSQTSYSAYSSKYEFLGSLAKADMLIRGWEHNVNLFTWVNCDKDPDCFYEQFMQINVDTNRWVTRSNYKYERYYPIYYVSFKKSFLQCILYD